MSSSTAPAPAPAASSQQPDSEHVRQRATAGEIDSQAGSAEQQPAAATFGPSFLVGQASHSIQQTYLSIPRANEPLPLDPSPPPPPPACASPPLAADPPHTAATHLPAAHHRASTVCCTSAAPHRPCCACSVCGTVRKSAWVGIVWSTENSLMKTESPLDHPESLRFSRGILLNLRVGPF